MLQQIPMTREEAKRRRLAMDRWSFAKTFVEPNLKAACNDDTAIGLLPNHQALIGSWAYAQAIAKCRKTAHSWGIALDAIARAATEPRSTGIIISINERESKEKHNFCLWIHAALPSPVKKELKMAGGSEELRFANGSRIQFLAHKAPTGSGGTLYLDEFSVEVPGGDSAADILTAAIGVTTHAGYIRIGGTARGPNTTFQSIINGNLNKMIADGTEGLEGMPVVNWEVLMFPWWRSPALCVDVEAASRIAEGMETVERVVKFGNERLKRQFSQYLSTPELGIDIFSREFECVVLDDSESYFGMELIKSCYPINNNFWFREAQCDGALEIDKAKSAIDQLARQCQAGLLTGQWAAAMDVGRSHDASVITVGHSLPEDSTCLALRLLINLRDMPFPQQQDVWHHLMKNIKTSRGHIDGTKGSVGRQLAEEMNFTYGERAGIFEFTTSSKQIISSGLKSRMEKKGLLLPSNPGLERQIHSIKKKVLPSGNVTFDAERNSHGHADGFWSLAMLSDLLAQPDEVHVFTPRVTHQTPQISGMRQRTGSHLWVPGGMR